MVSFAEVKRMISHATNPLRSKMNAMIARGVINAVNEASKLSTLKVIWLGHLSEPVEFMQPGGLRHYPEKGSEVIVLRTTQGIQFAIGGTDRSLGLGTMNLSSGDTLLYASSVDGETKTPDSYLLLQKDRQAFMQCASLTIGDGGSYGTNDTRLQTELARIKGELDQAKTDITLLKSSLTAMVNALVTPTAISTAAQGAFITAISGLPTLSPASPGVTRTNVLMVE